jgi:hypothetical protein
MMMQTARLFGLLGIVALISASHAQSLTDRLRDAGNISFRINNADYAVNIWDKGASSPLPAAQQAHKRASSSTLNLEP